MRIATLSLVFALAAVASAARVAGATDLSSTDVARSLQTIKVQADAVAQGRDKTQAQLRGAARTIGVEWDKVEPSVARDFLVEARFANDSIATFEHDWQNGSKARSAAKDVSVKVAELISIEQQNATPAPSATPSGAPSSSP